LVSCFACTAIGLQADSVQKHWPAEQKLYRATPLFGHPLFDFGETKTTAHTLG